MTVEERIKPRESRLESTGQESTKQESLNQDNLEEEAVGEEIIVSQSQKPKGALGWYEKLKDDTGQDPDGQAMQGQESEGQTTKEKRLPST